MTDLSSSNRLWAALAVIAACFLLGGMDAIGKSLQQTLPTLQVVWGRFFSHGLVLLLFVLFSPARREIVRTRRPGIQWLRSALLVAVTLFLYSAIKTGSLAESTAILFFSPVLVTLFAGLLLSEAIDLRKWLAVLFGLVGMLVLIRPGLAGLDWNQLWALFAAVCLAGYFLLTRYLHTHDPEMTTIFYTPLVGLLGTTLLMPGVWQMPDAGEFILLMLLGLLGGAGHYLLTWAFHRESASTLSPLLNVQILVAALYSAILFDDALDHFFYLGAGLIVLASVLVTPDRRPAPE